MTGRARRLDALEEKVARLRVPKDVTDLFALDKKSGHDHVLDALGYLVWSVANRLVDRTMRVGSYQLTGGGGVIFSFRDNGACTCFACRHGHPEACPSNQG